LTARLTDALYGPSLREPYIKKLKQLDPQLVKEVLVKLSRRELWADRLMSEEQVKIFLKNRGIEFGELVEDSSHRQRQFEGVISADGKDMSYIFEKTIYKPIGNIIVIRNRIIYDRDWKPDVERKPIYAVTQVGVTLEDFISDKTEIAEVVRILRGCGLLYVIKTRGKERYASVREDLKALVITLDELSRFKWSFIQIPEMKYFRPRTEEEIEITKRILGDSAEEYMQQEDKERARLQAEYEEWKKRPEPKEVHFLEMQKKLIEESRKRYAEMIREARERLKDAVKNMII